MKLITKGEIVVDIGEMAATVVISYRSFQMKDFHILHLNDDDLAVMNQMECDENCRFRGDEWQTLSSRCKNVSLIV